MNKTEAQSRIKINRLLEDANWRFFDDEGGSANIQLEQGTKITRQSIDAFGENFEKTSDGRIDFLLLDASGFPQVVLEAKREDKSPLDGKEQAREYAQSLNVRYIILSNGNIHYFWDMEVGNPTIITKFPTQDSLKSHSSFSPNPSTLIDELLENDYVAKTQKPNFATDPRYLDEAQRKDFLRENGLMLLRPYQLNAVKSIQSAVSEGSSRFLFEMATGTGKTLIAAAVIKLFLRSSNAKRVLFLVDRIELEDQAEKAFNNYLKNDYQTVTYKRARSNWNSAEIVVSTVQSLTGKYDQIFSPTDFDLIISDEAHRSIGGNARAVFEYFTGYKLGLTATPKDYLKNVVDIDERDPREMERRLLMDTYKTFGCGSGEPTFRYSLIDGVNEGFLIDPTVIDARTDITTELLSDQGYSVDVFNEETGKEEPAIFTHRQFEKKFFSKRTNQSFCRAFLENAMPDPISGEIGKTLVFCVSQVHASKITQILNEYAHQAFPGKYSSDFAVQVTSSIPNAQQHTINFTNNNLNGHSKFVEAYKSSKTRVCVTVGMMTTGYDCQDIQNLCLMRPIFSPTDFVQIKGRGTRTFTFTQKQKLPSGEMATKKEDKKTFKVFDFFANFEYFEEQFDYDEELKVTLEGIDGTQTGEPVYKDDLTIDKDDPLKPLKIKTPEGDFWKIDRKYWGQFVSDVTSVDIVKQLVEAGNLDSAEAYVREHIFDKPQEFFNLEKLRQSVEVDRRLTLRELLERAFDLIPHFKTKAEKLEEECDKFISIYKPNPEQVMYIKNFLKAYITDSSIRDIVESKEFAQLATHVVKDDFKSLEPEWREQIPLYVKDYVSINEYN